MSISFNVVFHHYAFGDFYCFVFVFKNICACLFTCGNICIIKNKLIFHFLSLIMDRVEIYFVLLDYYFFESDVLFVRLYAELFLSLVLMVIHFKLFSLYFFKYILAPSAVTIVHIICFVQLRCRRPPWPAPHKVE